MSLQEVLDPIKVLNLFKQIKVEVRFLGVVHKTRQFERNYLGASSHVCISVLAYMCVCVCVCACTCVYFSFYVCVSVGFTVAVFVILVLFKFICG